MNKIQKIALVIVIALLGVLFITMSTHAQETCTPTPAVYSNCPTSTSWMTYTTHSNLCTTDSWWVTLNPTSKYAVKIGTGINKQCPTDIVAYTKTNWEYGHPCSYIRRTIITPEITCPPVDCIMSDWSELSECDQTTCNTNCIKTRTRSIITPASNGGTECGVLSEEVITPNEECPCTEGQTAECVATVFEYPGTKTCTAENVWGTCETTLSCGDGTVSGKEECDGGDDCNTDCTLKTITPPVEQPKEEVKSTGCTSNCGGISGQYIWQANPLLWIETQLHFIEYRIEQLMKLMSK